MLISFLFKSIKHSSVTQSSLSFQCQVSFSQKEAGSPKMLLKGNLTPYHLPPHPLNILMHDHPSDGSITPLTASLATNERAAALGTGEARTWHVRKARLAWV